MRNVCLNITWVAVALLSLNAVAAPLMNNAAVTQAPVAVKEKKYNIQSNIVTDLVGIANLNISFRVSPAMSMGPTAMYWFTSVADSDGDNSSASLWSLGAQMQYAFNGDIMRDGFIINPFIMYNAAQSVDTEKYGSSGVGLGVLLDYQWMWQSGFNIQLGAGIGYSSVKTAGWGNTSEQFDTTTGMATFQIGYAF